MTVSRSAAVHEAHASLPPLKPQEVDAQRELDARFTRAMSTKDIDGAMSCFAPGPELILVLWGNVVRGSDAVRAGIQSMFSQYEKLTLEVNEVTYVPAHSGVIAVGTATYTLEAGGAAAPQVIVERWTDLREQIDGRWVYVLDHATIVPAA